MVHKPLQFKDVSFSYPSKPCFNNFNAFVPYGSHIAIIGRNGSGKSSLLKLITNELKADSGELIIPDDVIVGFVPQVIEDLDNLSGAERFHARLTSALALSPNFLLLDEPTNHLDKEKRKALIKMLRDYPGTLIVVTHDVSLIDSATNHLWHIEEQAINIFYGNYSNYIQERIMQRNSLEQKILQLNRKRTELHSSLMKEQLRSKKRTEVGRKNIDRRKWPTVVSKTKANRSNKNSDQKRSKILLNKEEITLKLANMRPAETIVPKFSMQGKHRGSKLIVSIREGQLGYDKEGLILTNINLDIHAGEKIAILGNNTSGKTTLIRGIQNDDAVIKNGIWHTVKKEDVGYLDQHYTVLDSEKTAFKLIQETSVFDTSGEIRNYLSNFLFRSNEEVSLKIKYLSQGEKCRLCLAKMACQIPKLIILDEITNNIDLETKAHVSQVLQNYDGALIIISHDANFLEELGIDRQYLIREGTLYEHC